MQKQDCAVKNKNFQVMIELHEEYVKDNVILIQTTKVRTPT
jgi:hypothetical protein